MSSVKVIVYVQSVKRVVGTEQWGGWDYVLCPSAKPGGYRLVPDYKTYKEPKYERALPENQEKFVEMVEAMAARLGFEVEIVDASRRKRLGIEKFPVLAVNSGEKLEGAVSEEQVERFLSKVRLKSGEQKR